MPGALGLLLRKVLYPRLLGACGRNVVFGQHVVLRHPHKIRIGDNVVIDDNCLLDAKGDRNSGIAIGSGVFVGRNTILSCKNGDIMLDEGVNIGFNCEVFSASHVRIGARTLLAAYCYVIGGDHDWTAIRRSRCSNRPARRRGVAIGAGAWLGAGRQGPRRRQRRRRRHRRRRGGRARRHPAHGHRGRRARAGGRQSRGRRTRSAGVSAAAGPPRPLNVLQVCDHLGWDGSRMHGVKRLFAWMIPRFDKTRFNVSLVSLRKRDVSEETLDALGIDIEYLHRSKFDPATLPALLKIIDRRQVDVLHLHGYGATTFGRLAGAIRGIPTILHEHANLTDTPWFQKVADRVLEPYTDIAIAVSESTAEFVRHGAARPARAREGRLPRRAARRVRARAARPARSRPRVPALGIAPGEFAVGTITRLHESKGNSYLVEAAATVLRGAPDGPVLPGGRRAAQAGARSAGAGARPRRSLRVRRLCQGRRRGAVGVRPERLPIALGGHAADGLRGARDGEAHRGDRRGRAARCPRARTITARIVPRRDAAALAAAIIWMIDHPDERARFAAAAAAAGRQFGIDAFVRKMERLYTLLQQVSRADEAPRHPAAGPLVPDGRSRARDAAGRTPGRRRCPARLTSTSASARSWRRSCWSSSAPWRSRRTSPAPPSGSRATKRRYYMIAHSLAEDLDMTYRREDLARVWHEFPSGPPGVFLKKGRRDPHLVLSGAFPFVTPARRRLTPMARACSTARATSTRCSRRRSWWCGAPTGSSCCMPCSWRSPCSPAYLFLNARGGAVASALIATAYVLASVASGYFVWMTPELFNFTAVTLGLFCWAYKLVAPDALPPGLRWLRTGRSDRGRGRPARVRHLFEAAQRAASSCRCWPGSCPRRRWAHAVGIGVLFGTLVVALFGVNTAITGDWNYQGGERNTFYRRLSVPGRRIPGSTSA